MGVSRKLWLGLLAGVAAVTVASSQASAQQQKRPNIVMLMTDDTGWNDFGAYSGGGAGLGHPTPKSIGLPKRARPSPTGTARPAALRAARRSSRAEFPSARHSRSWSLRAMRESPPQGDSYYCRIF